MSTAIDNPFKKLCRLAGECIKRFNLINDGDRILVGLSGGKDSFALVHLLEHFRKAAPINFEFVTATFDPGFPGFNAEKIARFCKEKNWEHHTVKLDIPQIITDKQMTGNPCMLCSRLRRGHLYKLAGICNCNKLALGQHLDDIIASFMMSLCRGQGLTSMAPLVKPKNPEHPQVIRILALAPEKLISEYASTLAVPLDCGKCLYHEQLLSGDRALFGKLINSLEKQIPELRSNIARSLGHVELEHLLIEPEKKVDDGI